MRYLSRKNVLTFAGLLTVASAVAACPYCTVESNTLTEEMDASDVVLLATLIKPAAPITEGPDELGEFGVVDPETGRAKFRVQRVLVGKDLMAGIEEFEAVFFGEPVEGQLYFVRGVGVDELDWNIPMPVSDAAIKYIDHIRTLPPKGPERMSFVLKYLQHEDPLLAADAYDEFARAPYSDVVAIKEKMDRDQLWKWIASRDVSPSRRSLFFTMLGVSGREEDIDRLHQMMLADVRVLRAAAEASAAAGLGIGGAIALPVVPEMVSMEQRRKQLGFNAMVGCYLKLTGAEGLDVVDDCFLKDPTADPTKVYGVLIALRFLGEETDDVSQERLLESMRLVLEKPDFAEQAITDLARWEDWSVLDRLVDMFKNAPPRTYVKEPIVAYLDQASRQEGDVGERATAALEEIETLDPDTVKRARSLMSFGFLARASAKKSTSSDQVTSAAQAPEIPASDALAPADSSAAADTAATPDAIPADPVMDDAPPEDQPEARESVTDSPVTPLQAEPATNQAKAETSGAQGPQIVAPDRTLLLGLPLLVAAGFAVLVWVVLRGGV